MLSTRFYRNARAYDIAFSDRDFDVECDFIEWCLKNLSSIDKRKKKFSFLELGSGPSRHAREFAARGWKSYALDLSEEMLEFANQEAEREGVNIETIHADMSDFKMKEKVDVAATLMESISHLTTNDEMINHFKSVSKALKPGGVYIIEATHPQFFFPDNEPNTWVSRKGKTKVEVTFGLPTDKYNSITQVWDVTTRMKITEKGEEYFSETITPLRWYLAQEMKLLIDQSKAFEKYWMFGSLYFIPPKELDESEDSDAMVIVLKKKK